MAHVSIFLSAVSAEFRSYRDALRHYLDRPNVTVKVQEDFIVAGTETLDMLDEYILQCDVVIHLVGDMSGAMAQAESVTVIRQRYPDFASRLPVGPFLEPGGPPLSYTQWEAWLALYHNKKLIIAVPENGAKRDETYAPNPLQQAAQKQNLARLAQVERYPGFSFTSADHFAAEVWRSGLLDILIEAGLIRKVINLPYVSLGDLFKGRDSLLHELAERLGPVPRCSDQATVALALTGLGGIGKTRLALEYAWRHAKDYPAMLLVGADSPEALNRNLAALCATTILDLPEKDERDESRQRDAAINWLQQHPGWLLILDNIDSKPAAKPAKALLPQLTGGHVLLTSRLTNWSAGVRALAVDLLSPEAAADFLLARTNEKRRRQANDSEVTRTLAKELGYLALALEQAGAYIAYRTGSFEHYLAQWRNQRTTVLAWYDADLMDYPKSVAITWQTSFDQLSEPARRLLQRLAWLAAEPIPESLLAVPIAGLEASEADPEAALAELKSYSLVSRSANADYFSVHRLVQEVTRRGQHDDPAHGRLAEALNWVNDAFVGDIRDVRDWPALEPLAPHARAVALCADQAGIHDPAAHLLDQVGVLLLQKAQHAEAEPLMRRALAIDEASFGDNHPNVARDLNTLAQLLQATNRLADAEPLMRRALAIDEARFGADHPEVATDLNTLAQLLQATNRLAEAAPLMRRALAIDEASFRDDHPNVRIRLNNLAMLLQAANRLAEAEPLMRRALAIFVTSLGTEHPYSKGAGGNYVALLQAMGRTDEEIRAELASLTG